MKKIIILFSLLYLLSLRAISGPQWLFFRDQNQYPGHSIQDIVVDNNNIKWVAIDSTIYKFDGNNWERLLIPTNIFNNKYHNQYIGNLYIENNSTLWANIKDGLVRYDGNSWSRYDTINSKLPNNTVFSMNFDKFGNKWICTKGLVKLKDTTWIIFNKSNSIIPTDAITGIAIDSLNNKWIIAAGYGLLKYDDITWVSYYATDTGFPMDKLRNILVDSKNRIWCICYGQGLLMFDNNKWYFYNKDRSTLPENAFESMALDDNDNLWLVGGHGLVKFDGINSTSYNFPFRIGFNQSFLAIDKNGNKFFRCLQDTFSNIYLYMGVFNENGIDGVTDVVEQNDVDEFSISPNPADKILNIKINNQNIDFIRIINSLGEIVLNCEIKKNENLTINTGNFISGIYFLECETINGLIIRKKFIKIN